ncbi:MAG: hypothetical protein E7576_07600 [Ruminococcaceae bacterium]|nr:hypothetical protein [Oscillospiraceae bacterium]
MNTLKVEALLAKKYGYKRLPGDLSEKYRQYFHENIPSWLKIEGETRPLYTVKGSKVCDFYDRIVIGDYGAFIEFFAEPEETHFIIQPGQEYRVNDPRYSNNVKYIWMTVDDGSGIKIYRQRKTVTYADYLPDRYYVSVHEVTA